MKFALTTSIIFTDSHIGDLGNIEADDNGVATVNITLDRNPRPTLYDEGNTFILGRTLVINEGKICTSNRNMFVANMSCS